MWQQVGLKVWSNLSSTVGLCAFEQVVHLWRDVKASCEGLRGGAVSFPRASPAWLLTTPPNGELATRLWIDWCWIINPGSYHPNAPILRLQLYMLFFHNRSKAESNIRQGQAAKPWGTRAKPPGRSLSPNLSSCLLLICLILLFRKWRNDRRSERNLCNCVKTGAMLYQLSYEATDVGSRLAACGPVKDGRHLVAYDLFDISVMVSFALLL